MRGRRTSISYTRSYANRRESKQAGAAPATRCAIGRRRRQVNQFGGGMSRCIWLLFFLVCAISGAQAQGSRAQSAASYVERGNGWLNKGELERAIDDYSLAIAFDGGHACAYHNRGLARMQKGDLNGALDAFHPSL